VWELPTMPPRFVAMRMIVSLPFPFMAAGLTWLVML
jgi:anaerobic glycerol-3-phosphate dehydrogenase